MVSTLLTAWCQGCRWGNKRRTKEKEDHNKNSSQATVLSSMPAKGSFGMRQPMDGSVFEQLEQAEQWCIDVMIDHYDRRLGLSDARIEPFKGMVDCGTPPDPALLHVITRICESVRKSDKPKIVAK